MDPIHIHKSASKINNEVFLLLVPPLVFSIIVATYVILTMPSKRLAVAEGKDQNRAVLGENPDSIDNKNKTGQNEFEE